MAATGLSADPTEYRARLADQSDDQIDAWAAELMRDVAIRRGVVRVVEDFRRAAGSTRRFRTGVRFRWRTAGGHRARRQRPADGPGDHPLRARPRDPRAGPRRPRPADRVPRRELRRDRLRLSAAARRRAGRLARARRPDPAHPSVPVPARRDRGRGAVAAIAGADAATAARLAVAMTAPPGLDRLAQRPGRRAPRRRPQARQADPGRARLAHAGRRGGGRGRGPLGSPCPSRPVRRRPRWRSWSWGSAMPTTSGSRGRPGHGSRSRSGSRSCRSTAGSGRRAACRAAFAILLPAAVVAGAGARHLERAGRTSSATPPPGVDSVATAAWRRTGLGRPAALLAIVVVAALPDPRDRRRRHRRRGDRR